MSPMIDRPGARLRELIATKTVPMPGAFNALCARAIERAGFEAVYISGAGLANSVYGLPDVGLTTLTEAAAHARAISNAVKVPVLSDADTGFGEAVNAARTVVEMEQAGLAGIHLEDQVLPKKCGHLDGKDVVPPEAMTQKLRAAVAARRDSSFLIVARTDAKAIEGLDAAIDRAKRYLDAGADAIFPEAMQTADEFAKFAAALHGHGPASTPAAPPPLLANMTEFGKSPLLSVSELGDMGYRMVIFPQTALRVGFGAISRMLADLKRTGHQRDWVERMQTRAELYELLDYDGLAKIDAAATHNP
jgi:methylisocitrate lyase